MGYVAIPQNLLGTALNEIQIKAALVRLNPGFHFDWATKRNIWHPFQDGKQGIYHNGTHLCSMDRGQIPQAPIWSTMTKSERVRDEDLTYAEMTDPMRCHEIQYFVDGTSEPSGYSFVRRQVKDRLLFIGWQATLRKIVNKNIPGVTAAALSRELGVTLDMAKEVEACEVAENRTHLYDASGREVSI